MADDRKHEAVGMGKRMNLTLGRKNAWTEMDRAGQQEIPAGGGRRLELWGYLDAYTFRPGEEVPPHLARPDPVHPVERRPSPGCRKGNIHRAHTDTVLHSPAVASSRKRGAISSAKKEIVSSISC